MSLNPFTWFGSGTGEVIKDTAEGIGSLAKDVREAITGEMSNDDKVKLATIESKLLQAQANINMIEASSSKLFVAGWRPFIGWVCGAGIAYEFVARPFIVWACTWFDKPIPPNLDSNQLMALVTAMLGLGVYRTVEKSKGVNGRH